MRNTGLRIAFVAAALTMFAGSPGCAPRAPLSGQASITIPSGGGGFNPSSVTVVAGTLITWVNQDSQPHSATSPGFFDSGAIPPQGGQWSWVASVSGQTLNYQDMIGGKISGSINILPITPTGP